MPWTRRQVRYLESSGSPLTPAQKAKMNSELHSDPSMGHKKKGSKAMEKPKYESTHITHHPDGSHTVEHMGHMKSASKSGAMMSRGEGTSYSAPNHGELISKLAHHLGIGAAASPKSEAAELKPAAAEPQTAEYEEDQAGE